VTWSANDSARNWAGVTSSADGSVLAAVVRGGNIFTSRPATVGGVQGSSVDLLYTGSQWNIIGQVNVSTE
jgi:hypothetical protein